MGSGSCNGTPKNASFFSARRPRGHYTIHCIFSNGETMDDAVSIRWSFFELILALQLLDPRQIALLNRRVLFSFINHPMLLWTETDSNIICTIKFLGGILDRHRSYGNRNNAKRSESIQTVAVHSVSVPRTGIQENMGPTMLVPLHPTRRFRQQRPRPRHLARQQQLRRRSSLSANRLRTRQFSSQQHPQPAGVLAEDPRRHPGATT